MKLKSLALSFSPPIAALLISVSAHAGTITGTVYENQNPYKAGVALAAPTGAASATFTVSNLNFQSNSSNYTIAGFLGSSLTSPLSPAVGKDTLNNTIFDFRGTTFLTQGATYTITHDDGMYLFINSTYVGNILPNNANNAKDAANQNNLANHSGEVINAGLPTAAEASSFVYTGPTGVATFDLLYTEVNGHRRFSNRATSRWRSHRSRAR